MRVRTGSRNVGSLGGLVAASLCGLGASGCGARTLTITQDKHVNTAMHIRRAPAQQTGMPLELNIVCVYPKDLDRDDAPNAALQPNSGITSEQWFARRPLPGDTEDGETSGDRFRLPRDQIFYLTNESQSEIYGKRIGAALRGAVNDGETIIKGGIIFDSWALHNARAVLYVFGRFEDEDHRVLRVPPAKFDPPGAYVDEVAVKIGVRLEGPNFGQYIEVASQRKMHGSERE